MNAHDSAESDAAKTTVEYGVELDDLGSTDLYHSKAGALAAAHAGGGRVVRITTIIEYVTSPAGGDT